jgi:hypothetical protein
MSDLLSGSLATLGYATKEAGNILEDVMSVNARALIVDTRLVPHCHWSTAWSQQGLQQRWGKRYIWRGMWLGNLNYNAPMRGIHLADAAQGIPWLIRGLEKGWTLILLCGCANSMQCHRRVIYELVLREVGNRLPLFALGEPVLTPHGQGLIDPDIPLDIQRMRNRYAVIHDQRHVGQRRYYSPCELQHLSVGEAPSLLSREWGCL